jgi:cytidine deaminase
MDDGADADASGAPEDAETTATTAPAGDDGADADENPLPLVERARAAHEAAHVPYSEYPVGAAIRTADGTVYVGCNIENANYSNSLHAEEVALAEAVKAGHRSFDAVAVSSAARDGVTPCGMCRQTLAEFCAADTPIYCDDAAGIERHELGDLLPNTISLSTLEAAAERRERTGDGGAPGE